MLRERRGVGELFGGASGRVVASRVVWREPRRGTRRRGAAVGEVLVGKCAAERGTDVATSALVRGRDPRRELEVRRLAGTEPIVGVWWRHLLVIVLLALAILANRCFE
jgi:hypothetical protein